MLEPPAGRSAWNRRIWQLSWPVMLSNSTIALVGIADTAVMGQLPDPAYIGAVAVGSTMVSAIYWILGFLRMGTTGLAAQAVGANRPEEVAAIVLRALLVALALSVVILLLGQLIASHLLRPFAASDAVEAGALTYFQLRLYGAPALLLYLVVQGTLFALQQMRYAMWLSIALNVSNIALDVLYVVGFGWEVRGVALATIQSEWLVSMCGMLLTWRCLTRIGWRGTWPRNLWHASATRALFQVSGALILRTLLVQLPFFMFTVIGARQGDVVLAANAILMQFYILMAYALDAYAHTAEAIGGAAYGARDAQTLRSMTRYTTCWAMGTGAVIGLLYLVLGPMIIAALSDSNDVQTTAANHLPWIAAAPILAAWAFLGDGIFIGTTRIGALMITMTAAVAVFAAVLWLSLDPLGNHGLWLAFSAFSLTRSILLAIQYPRLEQSCRQTEYSPHAIN